jgi:hypothetical protein
VTDQVLIVEDDAAVSDVVEHALARAEPFDLDDSFPGLLCRSPRRHSSVAGASGASTVFQVPGGQNAGDP